MQIDPSVLDLIETFGPIVLAAVGTILTATLGFIAAVAKWAWRQHQRRMLAMAGALEELAKAVKAGQTEAHGEFQRVWNAVQGLRAELQLANKSNETLKAGLFKVEGALESHCATLYQHIERLGRLDSKLEAVFRFIDAPRRATDSGG